MQDPTLEQQAEQQHRTPEQLALEQAILQQEQALLNSPFMNSPEAAIEGLATAETTALDAAKQTGETYLAHAAEVASQDPAVIAARDAVEASLGMSAEPAIAEATREGAERSSFDSADASKVASQIAHNQSPVEAIRVEHVPTQATREEEVIANQAAINDSLDGIGERIVEADAKDVQTALRDFGIPVDLNTVETELIADSKGKLSNEQARRKARAAAIGTMVVGGLTGHPKMSQAGRDLIQVLSPDGVQRVSRAVAYQRSGGFTSEQALRRIGEDILTVKEAA